MIVHVRKDNVIRSLPRRASKLRESIIPNKKIVDKVIVSGSRLSDRKCVNRSTPV